MRFSSKSGQELRTWLLFLLGTGLCVFFAVKGNPLGPWWTLIIGAFTCSAVLVSAVQAISGGMNGRPKSNSKGSEDERKSQEVDKPASTRKMGVGSIGPLHWIRSYFTDPELEQQFGSCA